MEHLSSITKKHDFAKVFANRGSFALKTLLIYYLRENPSCALAKNFDQNTSNQKGEVNASSVANIYYGFKVSKRVSKKSVVRNKIKRRLKHILRILVQENYFDSRYLSYSIIFIARKNIQFLPFQKLLSDVKFALNKLNTKLKIIRKVSVD